MSYKRVIDYQLYWKCTDNAGRPVCSIDLMIEGESDHLRLSDLPPQDYSALASILRNEASVYVSRRFSTVRLAAGPNPPPKSAP